MLRPLYRLPPGTRFRQPELDLTGTLVMVNECRARVRLDRPNSKSRSRVRTAPRGRSSQPFPRNLLGPNRDGRGPFDWTFGRRGRDGDEDECDEDRRNETRTQDGALDAAEKVLGETGTPMNAKALIEAMSVRGYWTSPGGATPHATLYSAILREIQKKGPQARFARAENGFVLAGETTTPAKTTAAKRTTKKPTKANDVPAAPAN